MRANIPLGTAFQYRCTGSVPLVFTCTALPPWPGDDEAVMWTGLGYLVWTRSPGASDRISVSARLTCRPRLLKEHSRTLGQRAVL